MRNLASILLWSVIAAAFIGPGTVTTAASAGSSFRFSLLWTLLFSTVACFVLQESSARLTVVSGRNLGEAIRDRSREGWRASVVLLAVFGTIFLGCAAYEAGNILGGVAGGVLATDLPPRVLTLASGFVAALLLWRHPPRTIARLLSLVVGIMGVAFLCCALLLAPPVKDLLSGALVPRLPRGSGILALGLVGTTVVPYNIFLGSGIAGNQGLRELRVGLAVAIGLGGAISMAVLVVGSAVPEPFSFEALGAVLSERLGGWAAVVFAIGLLGAGLSSAITAPLAAAVTARSLFGDGSGGGGWSKRSWRYRAVWAAVLLIGMGFGLSNVRSIPAIVLAQALNGLLLPLVTIFLFLAINDRQLMGERVNGALANALMTAVVWVTLILGGSGLVRALGRVVGVSPPRDTPTAILTGLLALSLALLTLRSAVRRRA